MDPFEYLEMRGHFNMNPGLERMEKVLRRFGDPHLSIPAVHVGGTNGKGSTSAIIQGIMGQFPIRTGLYTSPHLISVLERLKINGADIDRSSLGAAMSKVLEVKLEDELTYFELLTAASFLLMDEMGIDLNISEVGMGGRLDATNVLEPQAIGITSISMDHMDHLGDDPISITAEKCGIIKPSTPVVVGEVCTLLEERERCLRTILDHCTHNGCPVVLMSGKEEVSNKIRLLSSFNIPDWRIISVEAETGFPGTTAHFEVVRPGENGQMEPKFSLLDEVLMGEFRIPLVGPHQAYNTGIGIALSLLVLPFALSHSKLRGGDTNALSSLISGCMEGITKDYTCTGLREIVSAGLEKVQIRGRMERVSEDGKVYYIDGGHNIEAARSISTTIRTLHPKSRIVLLLAMMGDKEVSDFLVNLNLDLSSLVLTSLPYDRSMKPRELLEGVVRSGLFSGNVHIRPHIESAVELWKRSIGNDEIGLATGSFYIYPFIGNSSKDQNV